MFRSDSSSLRWCGIVAELFQHAVGVEEEPDGRDNWWQGYSESNMADKESRINLKDDLQHKWFKQALETLQSHRLQLSDYDMRFLHGLEDGYKMFGRDMKPSRKQFEHLRQVAFDFEKGA